MQQNFYFYQHNIMQKTFLFVTLLDKIRVISYYKYKEREKIMLKTRDLLFSDFPKMREITEEVKRENKKRIFTGGVRINLGMYRTDKEMQEFIKKSLERKLP